MTRRVFVYGTLRRGGSRAIEDHFPSARQIACGSISGTLYDLGAYPGLRLHGECRITGEIYQIDELVLNALDAYEGFYPDESERSDYQRHTVNVTTADDRTVACEIYEIREPLTLGCPEIPGGDWIAYAKKKTAA